LILFSLDKPEVPIDFKLLESSSNSVQLSWISGSNGGENSTYLLNVNQTVNLTTITDDFKADSPDWESQLNVVEIKGLQPMQSYEFKLLAYNSIGSSDYTETVYVKTKKPSLKPDKLPNIQNAQFNELREAICFDLEPNNEVLFKKYMTNQQLRDLIIKIDVDLNENKAEEENNSSSTIQTRSTNESSESDVKTYLISLNKLKYGQNCILYSQLVELDFQLRNMSSNIRLLNQQLAAQKRRKVFQLNQNLSPQYAFNKQPQTVRYSLVNNIYEFKKSFSVNISLCYMNDSSICAEKTPVYDYNADFSTYVTLIAIGCSAIFIFIVLLLASLCCCCCRPQNKANKQNDVNSKLVIKSFPILSAQQQSNNFDYCEGVLKSSHQNILIGMNGAHSSSSSSSSSSSNYNINSAESNKNYRNEASIIYEAHKYVQNASSLGTVESDVSSSASIENKTVTTSNGKSSSSHSPFTILNESNQINGYFSPVATSSFTQGIVTSKPPLQQASKSNQGMLYNGSNNWYVKAPQQQTLQMKQTSKTNDVASSSSTTSSNTDSYTAPILNLHKKLVYEVIV